MPRAEHDDRRCENCEFFEALKKSKDYSGKPIHPGLCHRYPPEPAAKLYSDGNAIHTYPDDIAFTMCARVLSDFWCGEWRPERPAPPKKTD